MSVKFTIFTPTYNRGNVIKKLYNSLCEQTYSDFEWLIIDNGTQRIDKIITQFKNENKVNIRYFSVKEAGINRAYNFAIKVAKGELFFKVDDDDFLTKNSLQDILNVYLTLVSKDSYAGVAGLRACPNGKVIGGSGQFNSTKFIDATNLQRSSYNLDGDKAECYFTDVLRKYLPFPVFEGETYTDESIIYNRIAADGYKLRWFNKIVYYTEYRSDGITKNIYNKLYNNPKTYRYIVNQRLNIKEFTGLYKFKLLCRYFEISHKKNEKMNKSIDYISYNKIFCIFCWFISYLTVFVPRKEIS